MKKSVLALGDRFYRFDKLMSYNERQTEDGRTCDATIVGIVPFSQEEQAPLTPGELPAVTKVDFNGPATIVFFADGTKAVSKCNQCGRGYGKRPCVAGLRDPQKDEICSTLGYCKEIGVMVAIAKRAYPSLRKKLKGWCL